MTLPHPPGRSSGKFGALPHPFDHHDLRLASFVKSGARLKVAPVGFGHDRWTDQWGMLGNDSVGDCVMAGADHETMVWGHSGGSTVVFTDATALSDYSAVTGYVTGDPTTDNGTDPVAAAKYRRTQGMQDATGGRHKIAAFVLLETGNWHQMLQALYAFEAVAFCFDVPQSAMDQFSAGHEWSYVGDNNIEGGHYVPIFARPHEYVVECVTWGQRQRLTRKFFEEYNNLGMAYISAEMLNGGRSPEGLDITALQQALSAL